LLARCAAPVRCGARSAARSRPTLRATAGRAPYFADWQFTVERTITDSSVFRASYHGVVGVKMLSRQQAQNQLDKLAGGLRSEALAVNKARLVEERVSM
jgi:hypothetical protein